MRFILGLFATWLMGIVAIGWIGAYVFHQQWRRSQDDLLVRESGLLVALCSTTVWQSPWESDPNWSKLEREWDLDLIPIYKEASSDVAASIGSHSIDHNQWTPLGWGRWRISRSVIIPPELSKRNPEGATALRVTRHVDSRFASSLWTTSWGLTCLAGSLIAFYAIRDIRVRDRQRAQSLVPVLASVRSISEARAARLPHVPIVDENLQTQFSVLRDTINLWLEELQQHVKRSDLVLGNLQEGVLAVDDKMHVLLANVAVRRMLDIPLAVDDRRSLVELVRLPRLITLTETVLNQGTAREDVFEVGAEQIHLRAIARPVPLGNDRSGALLTIRDETLLRKIEMVRRDFVTNASHELKTPLSAIRAYAETLQMGALEDAEASQNFLNGILSQADRINALVNGMLQLARVQAGEVTFKQVQFEFGSAIENCYHASEVVAKSNNVALYKDLPTTPIMMVGDPDAIETIVSNLLSNAVRYTQSGGQVMLSALAEDQVVVIRVKDTGVGIGKEDLSRIFERFYRVERARTSGGTGLGLAIVRNLVHAIGGQITVTSEVNVGSCFEVRLPKTPKS
jgi:two-component system, OmpR family, phosphate regulon sensor histidine kinase PhoR